jgi:hypothetical protein
MDTTTATDIVVLDEETTDTPDNEDSSNTAAIGAICIAAGVAVGTFVVSPVVNWVKARFSKTSAPTVEAVVEAVENASTEKIETV